MELIIGPRQSGKTTKLLEKIDKAIKERNTVIVCVSDHHAIEELKKRAHELHIDISRVIFQTHHSFLNKEKHEADEVFIDNTEWFLKRLVGKKGVSLSAFVVDAQDQSEALKK